jgi:hypothetical protein
LTNAEIAEVQAAAERWRDHWGRVSRLASNLGEAERLRRALDLFLKFEMTRINFERARAELIIAGINFSGTHDRASLEAAVTAINLGAAPRHFPDEAVFRWWATAAVVWVLSVAGWAAIRSRSWTVDEEFVVLLAAIPPGVTLIGLVMARWALKK